MNESETIKKGLKCDDCSGCPYNNLDNGCDWSEEYALAYIEQLETKCHQLLTKAQQFERERDAMLEEMRMAHHCCSFCKHDLLADGCAVTPDPVKRTCFEWRGVEEE